MNSTTSKKRRKYGSYSKLNMAAYLFKLINLIQSTIILLYRVKQQRSFIKKTLAIDIIECKKTHDTSLDVKDFKKITNYYGLAVPAVLGEAFGILKGKALSLKERRSLTYLGGLTGLFDDFFDKNNTSKKHILDLLENRADLVLNNSSEKLFITFYRKALENSANSNLVKDYFLKVYEAQVLSEKQVHDEIDETEIKRITQQKGGISMIFYRSTMDSDMGEEEKELLYNLGGLFQLENDIFDIYKDDRDGIKTLATRVTKIENLRQFYKSLVDQVLFNVLNTKYTTKNKKRFIDIILLIVCRGFVCLDRLELNEKRSNNVFTIKNYVRKDLICDMENPINILKTFNYCARYRIKAKE